MLPAQGTKRWDILISKRCSLRKTQLDEVNCSFFFKRESKLRIIIEKMLILIEYYKIEFLALQFLTPVRQALKIVTPV